MGITLEVEREKKRKAPEGSKRVKYEMRKLKRVMPFQSKHTSLAFWPHSFCSSTCWPCEQRGEASHRHVHPQLKRYTKTKSTRERKRASRTQAGARVEAATPLPAAWLAGRMAAQGGGSRVTRRCCRCSGDSAEEERGDEALAQRAPLEGPPCPPPEEERIWSPLLSRCFSSLARMCLP